MSKKQNNSQGKDNREYNLNLKREAVDRLVNADKKTYDSKIKDPGKRFRSKGFFDNVPEPIKALFIKFWFNGAVCFFIFWGLGMLVTDLWDMLFVMAVVLGMVNDLLVNNTFHFFAITPGSNNKWMMFPQKKVWTLFANVAYSFVVLAVVVTAYGVINLFAFVGVEPILFGLLYMAADMMFVGMKNLVIKIFSDAKNKVNVNKND